MKKRIAAALLLVAGCAPVPKPDVMTQVEATRRSAAAVEARANAPSAFAHAEKIRSEAQDAWNRGDHAGAQVLSEQAIAAYAHAFALARVARADTSSSDAGANVTRSQAELRLLEEEQARLSAEADALELRIKVARDAVPISPSAPGDASREKARLAAARSLALQARLLCGGARLLLDARPPQPDQPAAAGAARAQSGATPASSGNAKPAAPAASTKGDLDAATAALTKLEADLGRGKAPAAIDEAMRARATCLSVLTSIRRSTTSVSRAPGAGDALLADLSAAQKFGPSRDDRGVFITLRDLFRGGALTSDGEAQLAELGRVAGAHPAFPVLVVLHQDREPSAGDQAQLTARAEAVVRALKAAGASAVETVQAGSAAPLVDPSGRDRARNARVEVVFVNPETF